MTHELEMRDDGILRLALIGDVEKEEIEAYVRDVTPFLQAATEAEPLLILSDSSRMGKMSSAARKVFAGRIRDPRVGKVAIVGGKRYIRVLVGFISKINQRDNLRFFDTEEEALAWLKAES
jgi:hypothetical protein